MGPTALPVLGLGLPEKEGAPLGPSVHGEKEEKEEEEEEKKARRHTSTHSYYHPTLYVYIYICILALVSPLLPSFLPSILFSFLSSPVFRDFFPFPPLESCAMPYIDAFGREEEGRTRRGDTTIDEKVAAENSDTGTPRRSISVVSIVRCKDNKTIKSQIRGLLLGLALFYTAAAEPPPHPPPAN